MSENIETLKKHEFFNPEIKNDFIEYIKSFHYSDSYVNQAIYILSLLKPREELYNKDFLDFTAIETKSAIETIGATRANTFKNNKMVLCNYADWGQNHNYSIHKNEHPIKSLKWSDLSNNVKLDKEYFKDERSFFNFVEELYVYDYDTTLRVFQSKLYLYLCWYGFNSEEIFHLKPTNIDFENKIIYSPVCEYKVENVNQKVISLLRTCIEGLNEYYPTVSPYQNIIQTKGISDIYNHPDGVKTFKCRNSSIFKEQKKGIKLESENFGREVKPLAIEESGKFYRLYLYEKENDLLKYNIRFKAKEAPEYLSIFFRNRNPLVLYVIYLSWLNYFYGNEE